MGYPSVVVYRRFHKGPLASLIWRRNAHRYCHLFLCRRRRRRCLSIIVIPVFY